VRLRLLDAAARLAAPTLVGHQKRLLVHHRGLDARPGTHIDADLLAHEAAEDERRRGQHGDGAICHGCSLSGPELRGQRRGIGEIHDPRAAGPEGDPQIDAIFDGPLGELLEGPGAVRQPDLGVAVAVDQAIDMLEEVGPDSLRASIAAPRTSDRAGDEEQPDARHDEQARDIIKFMRPDLDLEHEETAMRQIDKHRLVGRIGAAVPANPRRTIIDRQGDEHDRPFKPAERPVDLFRIDAFSRRIERPVLVGEVLRAGHRLPALRASRPQAALSRRRPANRHRRRAS